MKKYLNGEQKFLSEIGIGEVFKIADIEFVKFYDDNGNTIATTKDCLFHSCFGGDNNFAKSTILDKLNKEVLSKIEEEIGSENIVVHEVDLLSLDGSNKWGKVRTKISLPTFDFYRRHVKIFDKYNPEKWWWLATPDTTTDHYIHNRYVSCVSPSGRLDINYGSFLNGIRPFLIFVSSIVVSCEE